MAIDPIITPPNSVEDALFPIIEMSDAQFGLLRKAIHDSAFTLSKSQLKSTALLTAQSAEALAYLVSSLAFLYHRVQELREELGSHEQAIDAVIRSLEVDAEEEAAAYSLFKSRVEECLAFSEKSEKHWKVEELRNGYLPTATEFASLVDLRPVFSENDGDMQIGGCIISVQFRIVTDSPYEKDGMFVFQLTEDGLEDMSVALARLQNKIAVLKDKASDIGALVT